MTQFTYKRIQITFSDTASAEECKHSSQVGLDRAFALILAL